MMQKQDYAKLESLTAQHRDLFGDAPTWVTLNDDGLFALIGMLEVALADGTPVTDDDLYGDLPEGAVL